MGKNTAYIPPATALPLTGRALIEASAGTGKTWTLTGILLRLLVETDYAPRQIVATTFTRAAAAEMRRRVQARLDDFQQLMVALIRAYGETPQLLEDDAELPARIRAWLDTQAAVKRDAVNTHLLLGAFADGVDGFIRTYERTLLARQTLNQMFIGTLDSLCQRWLRELALESGVEQINIGSAADAAAQLAHDHLRDFYRQAAEDNPGRFTAFYAAYREARGAQYLKNSQKALEHPTAPFVPLPELSNHALQDWQAARQALTAWDSAAVGEARDFLASMVEEDALRSDRALGKHYSLFPGIIHKLAQDAALEGDDGKFVENLCKAFSVAEEGTDPFKQGRNTAESAQWRVRFKTQPLLCSLHRAALAQKAFQEQLRLLRLHSLQANSEYVRDHLESALRHSGETTYAALLARLNATLEKNPALCQYLAHSYPVILVDEAQDLNHEQSTLLRRIYDTPAPRGNGLWLLVGDPKQAIYRFRGSDVQNYGALKNDIGNTYDLKENYRSSPALIAALNRYYAADPALGDNIAYQSVQAADARRGIVRRDGTDIADPVQWFAVEKAAEEPAAVVRLVAHLTSRQSRWLRRKDGGFAPLGRSDIMVLARNNSDLQTLENAFAHAGIDCERQADRQLFAQPVAQETAWLLAAILNPADSAAVRRLLAGRFYGFDLHTLDAPEESGRLARFHGQLARAAERWAQYGLLSALQTLWRDDPWGGSVWTRLAARPAPDAMRDLLDLRRVQEIISARAHGQEPRRFLDWWRVQLADPPDADWAHCLPLPGKNAVRLMTIHKAKGLQAPVVILAGMGKPQNEDPDAVRTFHGKDGLHLMTGGHHAEFDARATAESAAEARRLLYVALTRAEDLLFIAKRKDPYCFDPLKTLCANNAVTPQALDDIIPPQTDPVAWATPAPAAPRPTLPPLPDPGLRGWRKTSFSALAGGIPAAARDLAVHDTLDLELAAESTAPDSAETAETPPAALPFAFPRGPQAGSFLHEALEKIRWARRPHWAVFFRNLLAKHHLPELANRIPELDEWFAAILTAPLVSGATLARLDTAERELGFSLALDARRPLPAQALREHFAAWGKTLPLADNSSLYKYLRGEIDLAYEHGGRYHVLDYKSNHLGDSPQHYDDNAMRRAMDDHHYWLQAALYQVALHRLLKNRLPGYRPEQHLGSVEYYFIRAAQDKNHGHLAIDIPTGWLLHLDNLLGGNNDFLPP